MSIHMGHYLENRFRRVSFAINGLRERKETIEQLKILYLPITFCVSEKRLRGQTLEEMRSNTPPRYFKSSRGRRASAVVV
ncbi:hypothetical protein T05_12179 [Trichinella murrelli]|uniref:Uncharacterized protein n=1 Tax=Trichinella murrelli TaxID=144512 RepID=A0A0V0TNU7_9BILA|nr:hypothetical protein T05_12179 [Trichinella murrelli]